MLQPFIFIQIFCPTHNTRNTNYQKIKATFKQSALLICNINSNTNLILLLIIPIIYSELINIRKTSLSIPVLHSLQSGQMGTTKSLFDLHTIIRNHSIVKPAIAPPCGFRLDNTTLSDVV